VDNVTTIDDCDKVLEKPVTYYSKQPKWKAAAYWKTARRYLTLGKDEQALSQMCQSASVEPASPALGGLVNYFLRHRALAQAQAWAERGIAASKNNRTAKDALGDTFSQLGKVDEARALWLETAKLTEDKKTRMQAVARNWLKLAKKSQKGGDSWLAERLLRRAAAFDADNAEVAVALAATLHKNEQSQLAKNWAERALTLDPGSKEAQALLTTLK
jgi:Flp pilus assembly protein TadD